MKNPLHLNPVWLVQQFVVLLEQEEVNRLDFQLHLNPDDPTANQPKKIKSQNKVTNRNPTVNPYIFRFGWSVPVELGFELKYTYTPISLHSLFQKLIRIFTEPAQNFIFWVS